MNYCERTGVWAAFCERSYEGIGFNEDGIVQGLKPRQMFEGTTKFADVQILSGKSFRSFKSFKGDRVVLVEKQMSQPFQETSQPFQEGRQLFQEWKQPFQKPDLNKKHFWESRSCAALLSEFSRSSVGVIRQGIREEKETAILTKVLFLSFGVLWAFLGSSLVSPWFFTRRLNTRYKGTES